MPAKQQNHVEVNNFSGGYITEATDLNFPPNSFSDISNFVINKDGSLARRLGMDLEEGSPLIDSGEPKSTDYKSISTFRWREVAGSVDREFLVVQVGRRLIFFDAFASNIFLAKKGEIVLGEAPVGVKYSFASTEGLLVVVTGISSIILVSYNSNTETFSYSLDRLTVRDLWGIEETDVNYEEDPLYRGGLNYAHEYNLRNQSWGSTRFSSGYSSTADPVYVFSNTLGVFPSNSDQVWTGLHTIPVAPGEIPYENFSAGNYNAQDGYYPVASKGYFIIDALSRGEGRASAVIRNRNNNPGLTYLYSVDNYPRDKTKGGPTTVAEFAGRIFYSGFSGEVENGDKRSPNYTNYIFFSKLITKKKEITECYQEGDPTSRDNPDVVDTDGGFLRISEAKNIVSMFPLGGGLMVLSTSGIWLVSGESDYGFSATGYKSTKLSEVGVASPKSIVKEGGSAYFWADDSIYIIGKDQFGDFKVESIALGKIQKFYDGIPSTSKKEAVGVYDSISKTIRWVFTRQEGSDSEELVFDILMGCFYKHTIHAPVGVELEVTSSFNTPPMSQLSTIETVLVGTDIVMSNSEVVETVRSEDKATYQDAKYLVAIRDSGPNLKLGICYFHDEDFVDFKTLDGEGRDATAFAITGTSVLDDSSVDKQIPYITTHFQRTEKQIDSEGNMIPPSSCIIRGQWSFATGVQSKKWSPAQQAYRFRAPLYPGEVDSDWDNGFSVVTSKNKVRGKGPAFALRIETEPRKDCRMLGWNIAVNGNPVA